MEDTNFYSENEIEVPVSVPEDSSGSFEGTTEDIQNEMPEVQADVIIDDAASGETIPVDDTEKDLKDTIVDALKEIVNDNNTENIEEDNTSDIEGNEISDSLDSTEDNTSETVEQPTTLDYTSILNSIDSKLISNNTKLDTLIELSAQDTLNSELNEINLTNVLLILIVILLLVQLVVKFARGLL